MFEEKKGEAQLRKKAHQLGGECYKFTSPGNSGVVDRIVTLPGGRIWFVEMKSEGKKPDKLQEIQMATLIALGFNVRWISSQMELDTLMFEMEYI